MSRAVNLFDEISGVTTNSIESLNAVFKRWVAWKELSLGALVQMFYLVLGYYVNETRHGFCGHGMHDMLQCILASLLTEFTLPFLSIVGGYHLELKYKDYKTDASLLTVISGFSHDDAVARMKSIILKWQARITIAKCWH